MYFLVLHGYFQLFVQKYKSVFVLSWLDFANHDPVNKWAALALITFARLCYRCFVYLNQVIILSYFPASTMYLSTFSGFSGVLGFFLAFYKICQLFPRICFGLAHFSHFITFTAFSRVFSCLSWFIPSFVNVNLSSKTG